MTDTYNLLVSRLDAADVRYTTIDHAAEGRTEVVSALRGHGITQAAKCILLLVKIGKKRSQFVLAVIRGDGRVDIDRVKRLFNATYVGFAGGEAVERLAQSVPGSVLPFAMDEAVVLVVDPALLAEPLFYFNAARLDRSLAMTPADYIGFARPRIESIASYPPLDGTA